VIAKIKIWHFTLLIITIIIVLRFSYIVDLLNIFIVSTKYFFVNTEIIYTQLNLSVIDNIISLFLIVLLPILLFSSSKIKGLLSQQLKISNSILVLLAICFLFAPIITKQHPDFQKNISVTKLLPPFSSVDYIEIDDQSIKSTDNELKILIDQVIPKSFNENIIFIDSIVIGSDSKYYQSGFQFEIEKTRL